MFEQLLPTIHAKDKSVPAAKRKPKKGKGYDLTHRAMPHKYDHGQMLRDRLSGMTWEQVAAKHGVAGSHWKARMLCENSRAMHKLSPDEVRRLNELDRQP